MFLLGGITLSFPWGIEKENRLEKDSREHNRHGNCTKIPYEEEISGIEKEIRGLRNTITNGRIDRERFK